MRRWKSHFRMYLFHFVGFLALTNLFGKSLDTAHRYNGYIEDQLICKDSLIAFFSSSSLTYICLRYNCRCRDCKTEFGLSIHSDLPITVYDNLTFPKYWLIPSMWLWIQNWPQSILCFYHLYYVSCCSQASGVMYF